MLSISFKIVLANSLTDKSLVPDFINIASNSSLLKYSTPLLTNLSRGLSFIGISLINILSLLFIFT